MLEGYVVAAGWAPAEAMDASVAAAGVAVAVLLNHR